MSNDTPEGGAAAATDYVAWSQAAPKSMAFEGIEFVLIPNGSFESGVSSDNPHFDENEPLSTHEVAAPYYMGTTEVTQAQWNALMPDNPSRFEGDDRPVDSVSFAQAAAYAKALSTKTGQTLRLPTEAEWELACRAGTTDSYHYGHVINAAMANVADGSMAPGAGLKKKKKDATTAVKSYEANAFGLFDMHGNVWEWVTSPWTPNEATTPSSDRQMLRGGAWNFKPEAARSSSRMLIDASKNYDCNGFRLVLVPDFGK